MEISREGEQGEAGVEADDGEGAVRREHVALLAGELTDAEVEAAVTGSDAGDRLRR